VAIDLSGQDSLLKAGIVTIEISKTHPLIQLANALPWMELINLVVEDLKKTTYKGFWFMGRKIKVRVHLGAYLLQHIFNLTDRRLEYQIKDNAAFRLFCGYGIVEQWYTPDHTKIEEFRNRLSPETQRVIANIIAQHAVYLGFADPKETDFDSTVQEANISYPSDANLMTKLSGIGKRFIDFMKENLRCFLPKDIAVNMKAVKQKAREYFFLPKNKSIEIKREVFKQLHKSIKQQMRPVVNLCEKLSKSQIAKLPWNIRRAYDQIKNDAWRYLLDVGHFTRTQTIKVGKILSFHAKALACIKKGKIGKEFEFGRVFQLGRIKGNFLFVLESTSIEMNDKTSFIPLIEEHSKLFGKGILQTGATDKGYWSLKNLKTLLKLGISPEGLQKPSNVKLKYTDLEIQERLQNRRAGIEPLIGHAKHGGQLGKSRMKSDTATLAAGYGSILGFNLRQMIRHQQGKMNFAI
jgi:transposase, IS5 family